VDRVPDSFVFAEDVAADAVIVRHVELLSRPGRLAAMLAAAGRRGWWGAVTSTGPIAPVQPGVEQETLLVPPLRHRAVLRVPIRDTVRPPPA
jgi:hypothetical protein